jgi:hypothetical protein
VSENWQAKVNQGQSSFVIGYAEKLKAEQIGGTIINQAESKQSLAEAAAEIQQLLEQLQQSYPSSTTAEQMIVAAEAINCIESDPSWKQKIVNAVKEGGLAAFEKAIDNPAGAFVVGAIKGWQEVKEE